MTAPDDYDPDMEPYEESDSADVEDTGWPWSFVILIVAGAFYLIFRFVQLSLALVT